MKLPLSYEILDPNNEYTPFKMDNLRRVEKCRQEGCSRGFLPLRLTVQTTERCNLRCRMCQIKRPSNGLMDLGFENFLAIAKDIFPYILEMHPTNIGEPLMSPWFFDMCDVLSRYGVLLDLTTNGMLMNDAVSQKILPILKDVKISFDGADKSTFERIRQGSDYDRVLNNIINLISMRDTMVQNRRPSITLQMTLMKSNIQELKGVIDIGEKIGADRVKAYHLFSFNSDMDSESLMDCQEEYNSIYKDVYSEYKGSKIRLELAEPFLINDRTTNDKDGNIEKQYYGLDTSTCPLLWSETWVDVDGNVYPCHSHGGDPMGNINSQSISQIWQGEKYQSLRSGFISGPLSPICKGCGVPLNRQYSSQPVSYDINGYICDKSSSNDRIFWSRRTRQFEIMRKDR